MRRAFLVFAGDGRTGFHDTQGPFCFALKTKRGWVDPELLTLASNLDTDLVPYLERAAPRPLGPLGKVESVTLLEESDRHRTYKTVFGSARKVVCTVVVTTDGRAVSIDWVRPEQSTSD